MVITLYQYLVNNLMYAAKCISTVNIYLKLLIKFEINPYIHADFIYSKITYKIRHKVVT